jgi:hypothetical protein
MKIDKEELIIVLNILRREIQEKFDDEIELESNEFYWEIIPEEAMFDYSNQVQEYGLRQISNDWEELQRLTKGEQILSYDLNRIAGILHAIRRVSAGKW